MAEAAFMTGLERNADVVNMTSYAPLFAHAEGWQWTPDLIWFNNLESYATPNYYVQQLYGQNPGTVLVKITDNGQPVTGKNNMYATAVIDSNTKEVIIKIVNTGDKAQKTDITLKGKKVASQGTMTTLGNENLTSENNFGKEAITPKTGKFATKGSSISAEIPAYSFVVLKVKLQ